MKIKKLRKMIIVAIAGSAFLMPSATFTYAQENVLSETEAFDTGTDAQTLLQKYDDIQLTESAEEQTGAPTDRTHGYVNTETDTDLQEMIVVPEENGNDEAQIENPGSSGVEASYHNLKTADQVETGNEDEQEKEPDEKDKEKEPADGWNIVEGKEIYYKGGKPFTGWIEEGKTKIYVKEGKRFTGWLSEEGKHYYVNAGLTYTGWHKMGKSEGEKTPHWSYFGNDGVLRTGWVQFGAGTSESDGGSAKHWSYFGDNGWLVTGWKHFNEKDGEKSPHWSYFGDNGWLVTGWKHFNEKDGEKSPHWSYFGNNGWLATGWRYLDQKDGEKNPHWSYFGTNGWMRTGWVQFGKGTSEPDGNVAKHWSYFGKNGWLTTGWKYLDQKDGEKNPHWSYFGTNGWMRTGWVQFGKGTSEPDGNAAAHWSYFGSNGWLNVNNSVRENKKVHSFNGNGWLKETKIPVIKVINQRTTVFGKSGCGGAAALMALQATGYQLGVNYSTFWNTVPIGTGGDDRTGYVAGFGITNPAYVNWIRSFAPAYRNRGITASELLPCIKKGQTVIILVPSGSVTHFVVVYGYNYETGRYLIADPWGNTYSQYGYTYTLTHAEINSRLNTAAARESTRTREGVVVGEEN